MNKTLRKITCSGILALLLAVCPPVIAPQAQETLAYNPQNTRPARTPPEYVAMTFFKLSGQLPDFETWARGSSGYKTASTFEQPAILETKEGEMKSAFSLLTLQEPIVIEIPVKLSAYNATNRGFFIENFKTDTFFPVRYGNQSYAIIPHGITDKQWIGVTDAAVAQSIEAAISSAPDRLLTMLVFLLPDYADKSAPLAIDGESYWLMSADVKNLMLYPAAAADLLWQADDSAARDEKRQELLNLYQK